MKELRKVLLQEAMDSQETTRMKTGSDRASSVGKMILKLEDMDKFYKE